MRKESNKFINFKNVIEWAWNTKHCDNLVWVIQEYRTNNYTKLILERYKNGVVVLDDNWNFICFCNFSLNCKDFSKHVLKSLHIKYKIERVYGAILKEGICEHSFEFNLNDYSYNPKEII